MSFTPKTWNDNDILSILDLNRLEEAVAEMGNYTPTVWAVGDKITAEKMNKLEQGVAGEFWNTVFEGNVTTVESSDHAQGEINANITANTIKVTFNGTEYTCEKKTDEPFTIYGDTTYTEYPFAIVSGKFNWYLSTQTAGTYSLKIEELQSGGSSDFSTAEVTVNVEGFSSGMQNYYISNAVHVFNDELRDTLSLPFPSFDYTNPVNAVLYKGKIEWQINAGSGNIPITRVAGTGNIEVSEYEGDFSITITGDGSLTITYAANPK